MSGISFHIANDKCPQVMMDMLLDISANQILITDMLSELNPAYTKERQTEVLKGVRTELLQQLYMFHADIPRDLNEALKLGDGSGS